MESNHIEKIKVLKHSSAIKNRTTGETWWYNTLYKYNIDGIFFVTVGRKNGMVVHPKSLTQQTFKKLNPSFRRDHFEFKKIKDSLTLPKRASIPPLPPEIHRISEEKILEMMFSLSDGCLTLQNKLLDVSIQYASLQERFIDFAQTLIDSQKKR